MCVLLLSRGLAGQKGRFLKKGNSGRESRATASRLDGFDSLGSRVNHLDADVGVAHLASRSPINPLERNPTWRKKGGALRARQLGEFVFVLRAPFR